MDANIAIFGCMLNPYEMEEYMRQRTERLHKDAEQARRAVEGRGRRPAGRSEAEADRAQMVRPDPAQKRARIWRLRSFPAWSRGSSSTKSIERGRL